VALGHELTGRARVCTDLVLADVRMPVCSGLRILRELRAVRCFLPAILMTAFGDETTRNQAHTLGAVLFGKPFDLKDLRTAAALRLRRGR
jgi:DNA-binding response OmpR family regulator